MLTGWDFGAPGCHPSTLIDLANSTLVSKSTVEPIGMISGDTENIEVLLVR